MQLSGSNAEILNKQCQQSPLCDEGIFNVNNVNKCIAAQVLMQCPLSLQHSIIWRIDDRLTFAVLFSIMKNHKGKAM